MTSFQKLCPILAASALLAACGGGGGDAGGPPPTVSATSVSTARYSETLLVTLVGTHLDQPLTLSSAGCKSFVRGTSGATTSTATTAYYTCTVSGATGSQSVAVSGGGLTVASVGFTVAVPQVTMIVTNGAGVTGNLVITLDPDRTPRTVDNFLAYVKSGFYNNTVFHRNGRSRTGGDFVLQGGGYAAPLSSATRFPLPKATQPAIPLERGLSNLRYTVAMARAGALDSATSEFFINVVDNAFLDTSDGGYAAFGTITTGTTVVDAMNGAPCNFSPVNFGLGSNDCVPEPNLVVASALQTR